MVKLFRLFSVKRLLLKIKTPCLFVIVPILFDKDTDTPTSGSFERLSIISPLIECVCPKKLNGDKIKTSKISEYFCILKLINKSCKRMQLLDRKHNLMEIIK